MVADSVGEEFEIVTDSAGRRARIGFKGEQGTELLIVLMLDEGGALSSTNPEHDLLRVGEACLRDALAILAKMLEDRDGKR